MQIRFYYLLIALIFSCSNSGTVNEGKWEVVKANGINPENKLFDFLSFPAKGYGLMFGSSYSDENLLNKKFEDFNSVYYFSNDSGSNWIEKRLGKGKFTSYSAKNNHVFLCKEILNDSTDLNSTIIYFSNNYGETFNDYSSFSDFFIRDIFVFSESEIYIVGKQSKSKHWTVRGSVNGGKTWNNIGELENDLQSPIMVNRSILYLTYHNGYVIKKLSLIDGTASENRLPPQLKIPYFIASESSNTYILGTSGKNVYVCKSNGGEFVPISQVSNSGEFPVYMQIVGNKIHLLLGERNSIGVTYSFYSKQFDSSDWDKISVPSSYFKPFAFSETEIWGYSFDGKFYKKAL